VIIGLNFVPQRMKTHQNVAHLWRKKRVYMIVVCCWYSAEQRRNALHWVVFSYSDV